MSFASDKAYGKVGGLALGLVVSLENIYKDNNLVVRLSGPYEALDAANKSSKMTGTFSVNNNSRVACGVYYLPGELSSGKLDMMVVPVNDLPCGVRDLVADDGYYVDTYSGPASFQAITNVCCVQSNPLLNDDSSQRLLLLEVVFGKKKAAGLPPYDIWRLAAKRDGSQWASLFCGDSTWYDFKQRPIRSTR